MLSNAVERETKDTNDELISTSKVTKNIPEVVDFSSKSHTSLTQVESTLENDIGYLSVWEPIHFLMFSHV